MLALITVAICGGLMATQATMNAGLGRALGLPFFTVVFSFLQLAFSIPYLIGWGWPPATAKLADAPWLLYVGAPLGVLILAGMSYGLSRTGTFAGFVSVLFGQLFIGALIDQFGLFGAPVHQITVPRAIGIFVVTFGVWLART
jgi:transporter family-2 protein